MAGPSALPPLRPPKLKLPALRPPNLTRLKARLVAELSGLRAERLKSWLLFGIVLVRSQLRAEWAGSPPHRWLIARPEVQGRAAAPLDLRPPRPRRGKTILAGRFTFDGLVLEPGEGGNPWNRASPSLAFAIALHSMAWLPDLLTAPEGARRALRLVLDWQAVFGRWNAFSWSSPVLERRVFNLACSAEALCAVAAPDEAAALLNSLARQARHLLSGDGESVRAAEQAAAVATAGCALGGRAGEQLRERALNRLCAALETTVLPDGGHASRSPEAAMELLFDLRTLDGALQQLGLAPPPELNRAIDRLTGALRFFTLADGRLPAMQGGEAGDPERIAAAREHDPAEVPAVMSAPHSRYEKLAGKALQVMVDVGAPARGPWSRTACAQPLALEVLAGADRLIVNTGWSPRARYAQALRLTPAGSTANLSDRSAGWPLQGLRARVLGRRLIGAVRVAASQRHEGEGGTWLEAVHDGWARVFGLTQTRRLYLDSIADELRGEDLLAPADPPFQPRRGQTPLFLVARFQLHPEVKASLAMDHKSVLLQGPTGGGWWLRNDAPEVRLEPSVHLVEGRPQHAQQVVMRVLVKRDGTARIRWKLSAAEG